MPAPNSVRVLVVAADNLTGAGLSALISELPGFSVVGQTPDAEKMAADIDLYEPDIVVWDVSESPERLTLLQHIDAPVIAIVATDDAAGLAWSHGARGILSRNVGRASLAAAIRAAAEGLTVINTPLAQAIVSSGGVLSSPTTDTLTPRELQILQLVAAGMTNKSIASELGVSEHTVKFHVNSILGKLDAQSRTQAVTIATKLGLIRL